MNKVINSTLNPFAEIYIPLNQLKNTEDKKTSLENITLDSLLNDQSQHQGGTSATKIFLETLKNNQNSTHSLSDSKDSISSNPLSNDQSQHKVGTVRKTFLEIANSKQNSTNSLSDSKDSTSLRAPLSSTWPLKNPPSDAINKNSAIKSDFSGETVIKLGSSSSDISKIANYINIENIPFYFSDEFKRALRGERDDNHKIDLDLLSKALKTKITALKRKKITKYGTFANYFKVNKQILNIVVGMEPLEKKYKKFFVITAYFAEFGFVRSDLKLTNEGFKEWVSKLKDLDA